MATSIRAVGMVKDYGAHRAVDGLTLEVAEGEFFGFLGPNGAGKSTTIRMLTGLLAPTAGRVEVAGYDLAREPLAVKAAIGVLPEETSVYERLTGRELLLFAGQMHSLEKRECGRRAGDLLSVMALEGAADQLIADYSMGMKKKVALAAALIHRPRVLFLDEPFNGIDPISVRAIREVLQLLRERGTTIFFTSHVMEVVERLCTRIAVIQKGRLVGVGTLDELRAQAGSTGALEEVFLTLIEAPLPSTARLSWL